MLFKSINKSLENVQLLHSLYGVVMIEMNEIEKARFWVKAEDTGTCWVWKRSIKRHGYGVFGHKGKTITAHRASYELLNGEIPKGLYVLHTCDNPACINPDHLWVGSQKDNMKDRVKKGHFKLGKYSKFKGVKFRTDIKRDTSKKWGAYVTVNKKLINLGSYHTQEEAALIVDKYKMETLGINYGLNFPEVSHKK